MEPGELLRTVRRRQGMSQDEVARRAGTSQPVISAYENGRRDPTVGTLRRLVQATGEQLVVTARARSSDLPPAADLDEHAHRLLDVLSLADAVPHRPRARTLRAPRLVSS
jgi:hypothetical protein